MSYSDIFSKEHQINMTKCEHILFHTLLSPANSVSQERTYPFFIQTRNRDTILNNTLFHNKSSNWPIQSPKHFQMCLLPSILSTFSLLAAVLIWVLSTTAPSLVSLYHFFSFIPFCELLSEYYFQKFGFHNFTLLSKNLQ